MLTTEALLNYIQEEKTTKQICIHSYIDYTGTIAAET